MIQLLSRRLTLLIAALLVGATALTVYAVQKSSTLTLTADFDRSTGLYTGSDVKILGVKVGKVTKVEPNGDHVRVTLKITEHTDIPADAKAAIVAPSLVSGRYVQLAPIYDGGPKLKNDALIPRDRTAVPVEWDDIKAQLTNITRSLAPTTQDKDGSLKRFVESAAGAFEGNGDRFKETIAAMSSASQTLSGNSDNLYVTVSNLADFVGAMNDSSQQIAAFVNELESISSVLGENQKQLSALLGQSRKTVATVRDFVTTNRAGLDEGVARLTAVTDQITDKQTQLANILHLAPTTVANFYNIYDPTAGTLTGRLALAQTKGFANVICQAMFSAGGTLKECQSALAPLLDTFNMDSLPFSVNPLNQPGASNQADPKAPASTPAPSGAPAPGSGSTDLGGLTTLLLGGRQ